MGFWTWFAIWSILAIAALGVLGFIGYELFGKVEANLHQIGRLQSKMAPLMAALEDKEPASRPAESLLDPEATISQRKSLVRARESKAQDRQRRLIARLKDFKPQEGRFRK
jgi:hypothetical protein